MSSASPVGQVLADIRVSEIREHPGNPREHFEDLEDLAASIMQVGLLEPIILERLADHDYRLIAGARRLRAARLVRLTHLPAIVRPPMRSPLDALTAMMVENSQRRNLDPIEEARGYARMLGLAPEMTQVDVAHRVGRSPGWVSQRMALLKLTPGEQEAVRRGDLLLTEAKEISRERSVHGGRGKTRFTGWHFGSTHPLADHARARCARMEHRDARKIGAAGCGECWEAVIRADEREQAFIEKIVADDAVPDEPSSAVSA